jgi:hypothetical protein
MHKRGSGVREDYQVVRQLHGPITRDRLEQVCEWLFHPRKRTTLQHHRVELQGLPTVF